MELGRRVRRYFLTLGIVVALLLGATAASSARAAQTRAGDDVVIGATEVVDENLYVTGRTITIDGTVNGDVVAAASRLTINGTVKGDVLAGAQTIVVNGTIGDDLRGMCEVLLLGPTARVSGDVAFTAASLESQSGSLIGRDVLFGGYQAQLSGSIGGDLTAGANRLELRGPVGGDVLVSVNDEPGPGRGFVYSPSGPVVTPNVPAGLTVAGSAQIGGKLSYSSYGEATIAPSAEIEGGVAHTPVSPRPAAPVQPGLEALRYLAALLLFGALLLWLAPAWSSRLSEIVGARPLPSLAWGVVMLALFGVAVLGLLIVTILLAVIFGYLTLGGLVAWIVAVGLLADTTLVVAGITYAVYVAAIIVSLFAGRWLVTKVQPAWAERPFVPLLVGLVVYVALTAIPWIGPIIGLLVVLLGFGALWEWASPIISRRGSSPRPVGGLSPA